MAYVSVQLNSITYTNTIDKIFHKSRHRNRRGKGDYPAAIDVYTTSAALDVYTTSAALDVYTMSYQSRYPGGGVGVGGF